MNNDKRYTDWLSNPPPDGEEAMWFKEKGQRARTFKFGSQRSKGEKVCHRGSCDCGDIIFTADDDPPA